MSRSLRGAVREGDHVEYDGKLTFVGESVATVFVNGVRAAHSGTPLVAGGAVDEHTHDVYIGALPGGGASLPPPPLFHIHLDADRDGAVDDDHRRNDEWTWDRRYPGAIVMVNLDPDQKLGPRDPAALAPLAVRRDPRTTGHSTAGWKGFLRVSSKYKLRILDAAGSSILIGPDTPADKIEIDLSRDETQLTMEGVQFPGIYPGPGRDPDPQTQSSVTGFDGQLRLYLELVDPNGMLAHHEVAQLRVAPWVAFNHSDPTETVYVNSWGHSQGIRDTLAQHTSATVRQITQSSDQWTQDQGELGFSTRPISGGRRDQRSIMTVKNDTLDEVASPRLQTFRTVHSIPDNNLDFGGNLECTPPFVHPDNGRAYPFGRIYYGHPVQDPQHPPRHVPVEAAARVFFDQQAIQDPFQLDSGWLRVGHIDELISCIPMNDARLGFRVMYTSPRLAAQILDRLPPDLPVFGPHAAEARSDVMRSLRGYKLPSGGRLDLSQLAMTTGFLAGRTPYNVSAFDFRGMIDYVEEKVEIVRDTFKRECGLRDDDFIPVPVVFMGVLVPGSSVSSIAFTPGIPNGLAVTVGPTTWGGPRNITFVAPKPFGPLVHADGSPPRAGDCLFEEAVIEAMGSPSRTGVTVRFADAFVGYHLLWGEVHCGTNALRVPPSDRVWWAPREDPRRRRP
ncbi:MAG: protein-arginine deiminase family protein [Polyangiaceae bacterium]